jgi:hypothetical protein
VERITAEKQDELLRVCHSKVGTLVSRMVTQLQAFSAGKQPLAGVLVRLLALLAVLRQLRGCDGRVAWVERGKTTVPEAQRLRLLEGIMVWRSAARHSRKTTGTWSPQARRSPATSPCTRPSKTGTFVSSPAAVEIGSL